MTITQAQSLAKLLPDIPRWVEVRAMLLSGECRVMGDPDIEKGCVVLSLRMPLAFVIDAPGKEIIRQAIAGAAAELELLVVPEHRRSVDSALDAREWRGKSATLHLRHGSMDSQSIVQTVLGDVVLLPLAAAIAGAGDLPDAMRRELAGAMAGSTVAMTLVEGKIASFCCSYAITETLWDASVDTMPEHRRRGYAAACFHALDRHMTKLGKRPVWGALDGNEASLGLARSLGFEPVDHLIVFTRALDDQTQSRHRRSDAVIR